MKKLFLNSYFVLLSVLALGFSACTEEVEYTPAEKPASDQVYFSQENSTEIELKKEATEFSICLMRQNAEEELSVPVKFVADELAQTLCTFPESIKFEKYSKVALYTIKLNGLSDFIDNENGYDKKFNITLSIDDEKGVYTTPYGNSTFTFKAFVPAPWSEWTEMSGVYNFSLYVSGAYPIPVYYREHMLDKTKAQFLLGVTEIGTLADITVDYNKETGACQVAPVPFLTNSNYGPVYVSDMPHYPLTEGLSYESYPCTYDKETGLFSLNLIYFISAELGASASGYFAKGVETVQLDGFTQYDYNFAFNYAGYYVDQKNNCNAVISTAMGKDLTQVAMTMVKAEDDIEAAFAGMIDGTLACDTLKQSGYMAYPVSESGNYVALAVSYDKDGKILDSYTTEFEFFMPGQSSPWQSIGMATYVDDFITPLYTAEGSPSPAYAVEVLENVENPGLYRLVDPYGANYVFNQYAKSYIDGTYIEIDATVPDAVWIEGLQSTGLDLGDGELSISSMAWYSFETKEEAKAAGYCGTLVDGVITFPTNGLLVALGSKAYYANGNGAFVLDLNAAAEGAQYANAVRNIFNMKFNAAPADFKVKINKGKFFENRPETVLSNF